MRRCLLQLLGLGADEADAALGRMFDHALIFARELLVGLSSGFGGGGSRAAAFGLLSG